MADKTKRPVIGLLVSGITEHFIVSICKGVMHAAKAADVDLVVLPGKYIDRDLLSNKEIRYEYQYNTVFDYASADTLDAVIVAADVIGCFASKMRIGQMLEKYSGMPCVLIASKFPGYVSVNSDNYEGIRQAMEYLIQNKNCTRFGMIGGPDDNTDARERKEAFLQILQNNKLLFHPENFVVGDLSRQNTKAAAKLLDQNPDIQAVFCVNDDVAITLYEEMKKRDLVPGRDIFVFGYDNSAAASKVSPTLSSVQTNKNELGEKALQTVLKMLRGEPVESQTLPGHFIMRESIGGKRTHLDISGDEYEGMIASYVDSVFYNSRLEESDASAASRKQFEQLLHKLLSLMELLENDAQQHEAYYEKYADIMECAKQIRLEDADVDNLLAVYEELCTYICHTHKNVQEKYEIRQLFEILYRRMVRDMNYQLGKNQDRQERDNYSLKLFVSETMQFERGSDQSYTKLISDIGFLGITEAGVYVFDKPMTYLEKDQFVRPEVLYRKAILKNKEVRAVPAAEQRVKVQELFHLEGLSGERFSVVCLPIFSNELLYGMLICNLSQQLFENGEFLVNQIGSAAKMIDLLRFNEKIQQKLEESLAMLRENNIKLDTISKSDPLTGIMNRRGFYAAAEGRIAQFRVEKKNVLFAYIDMNNLKIINDRYGHEEGDFSLKLIGQILADTVQGRGIAGRIGGDEYACVVGCENADGGANVDDRENATSCENIDRSARAFVRQITEAFAAFNASSDKAYNITVSVGTYVMSSSDNEHLSLSDALSHADESLYEAKKHRVKEVAK